MPTHGSLFRSPMPIQTTSVVHFTFVANRAKSSSTATSTHPPPKSSTTSFDPLLLNAVRPTTSMTHITTQRPISHTSGDVPRTTLIGIGAITIITTLTVILCCVFNKKNCFCSALSYFSGLNTDDSAARSNGKLKPATVGGYTSISPPSSDFPTPHFPRPQVNAAFEYQQVAAQNGSYGFCKSSTLPTTLRNGYGTMASVAGSSTAVVPNTMATSLIAETNQAIATAATRSAIIGLKEQNSIPMSQIVSSTEASNIFKKDFKEWYV